MTVSDKIRQLNQKIRGWMNYFSVSDMKMAMKEIDRHLRTHLRVISWKQWLAPKTCMARAISKRILAKKGLISCLDYYILRHNLKIKTKRLVLNCMLGGLIG